MAETDDYDSRNDFKPGPAATSVISLSQAILAPLDAISKAQIHAARSFLNFVLQIAFPHEPDKNGTADKTSEDQMYLQTFKLGSGEGGSVISIPSLALVPIQPLVIEKAQYDLELVVEGLDYHRQMQKSEEEKLRHESSSTEGMPHAPRKWYLVSDPVSVRGTLSDPGGEGNGTAKKATIKVHVEVGKACMPSGLEKILASSTQVATIDKVPSQTDSPQ